MNIHTKTAIDAIKRSPFQAMSAVFVMTLTFFVATTFAILVYASSNSLKYVETRPQIIAFLKKDADENRILEFQSRLNQDIRVKDVKFVPKEQALEIYKESTSDNPLLSELVSPSIFPASLEFSVSDITLAQAVISEVEKEDVVDQVGFTANIGGEKTLNEVIDRLKNISNYVRIGGLVFVTVLSASSFLVLLVIISMRMTSRKGEIEILSLIGATPGFVRKPIILEAILYVLIGVTLGWILSFIMWLYISPNVFSYFGQIPILPKNPSDFFILFVKILACEIIIGLVLAFLGTVITVKRSLKKSR